MGKIRCGCHIFHSVEAILFDKDGTLADSQNFLWQLGLKRADQVEKIVPGLKPLILQSFGSTDTSCNPAGLLAVGTRQENEIAIASLIAQTGQDWITAKAIAAQAFLEADQLLPRKADLTPLFPGIFDLVRSLNAQGFRLGILSSDSSENVKDFTNRYEINPYFHVQIGAQAGMVKPDPCLLHLACTELGTSPQTTLVIGDSQADLELAQTGGAIAAIGVTWGGISEAQLAHADAIAHQVADIQALETQE